MPALILLVIWNSSMSVLRQPLVHFLVLGAVIMAADIAAFGKPDDPRRIVLNDDVYAEIAGVYRDNIGAMPSAEEMETLTRLWLQNEMIYREARIMGLDKGDEAIRSRLNLKLRDALANQAIVEKPDEAGLRAWFEANRAAYDQPESFDFSQMLITDGEEAARAMAAALNAGESEAQAQWATASRGYQRRPRVNLDTAFGEADSAALIDADGAFLAVSSERGWHVARVSERHPAEAVDFESVRQRVGEDYKMLERERLLLSMYDEIAAKFEVVVDLKTPPEAWDESTFEEIRLSETQRSKAPRTRFTN